jgi:hypothetical protein
MKKRFAAPALAMAWALLGFSVCLAPAFGEEINVGLKERSDGPLQNSAYAKIFEPYRTYLALPPEGQFTLDD